MFEYIARAHARGWVVVVSDPHADKGSPHRHMLDLSKKLLASVRTRANSSIGAM